MDLFAIDYVPVNDVAARTARLPDTLGLVVGDVHEAGALAVQGAGEFGAALDGGLQEAEQIWRSASNNLATAAELLAEGMRDVTAAAASVDEAAGQAARGLN